MISEQDLDKILSEQLKGSQPGAPTAPPGVTQTEVPRPTGGLLSGDEIDKLLDANIAAAKAETKPKAVPPPTGLPPSLIPAEDTSLPAGSLLSIHPIRNWMSYLGLSSQLPPEPTMLSQGAENVLTGIRNLVPGIPHYLSTAFQASPFGGVLGYLTSDPEMQARATKELTEGLIAPIKPLGKAAINVASLPQSIKTFVGPVPPPNSPEWIQAQQGAGANLGSLIVPSAIKGILGSMTPMTPEEIMANPYRTWLEQKIGTDSPTPTRSEINQLSTVVAPGVKSGAPQPVAIAAQPFLKQAFNELGLNRSNVAVTENAPQSDLLGDLYRGTDQAMHTRLSNQLARESGVPDYQARPLPIEVADRAVEIAHRPIERVIGAFGDQHFPAVKTAIVSGLMEQAKAAKIDPALANAYRRMADEVRAGGDTARDINEIKVHANKETGRLFNLLPSQQVSATANPIYAYQTAADLVRQNLYPAIKEAGGPDLSEFGQREAATIRARDGIYSSWARSAGEQAPAALQTFVNLLHGETGLPPLSRAAAAGRVLGALRAFGKQPLAKFNETFAAGVGEPSGTKPIHPLYNPPLGSESQLRGAYNMPPVPSESYARGEAMMMPLPTPAPLAGAQLPLEAFPGPLGQIQGLGPKGEHLSPTEQYYQDLARRGLWQAGAPAPPPKGQIEMTLPSPIGQIQGLGPKGTYLTPTQEYLEDLARRGIWRAAAPGPLPPGQLEMFPGGPPTLFPPMEQGVPTPPPPPPPSPQGQLPFGPGGVAQTPAPVRGPQGRLPFPLKTPTEIWLERRLAERFPGAVSPPKEPPK